MILLLRCVRTLHLATLSLNLCTLHTIVRVLISNLGSVSISLGHEHVDQCNSHFLFLVIEYMKLSDGYECQVSHFL